MKLQVPSTPLPTSAPRVPPAPLVQTVTPVSDPAPIATPRPRPIDTGLADIVQAASPPVQAAPSAGGAAAPAGNATATSAASSGETSVEPSGPGPTKLPGGPESSQAAADGKASKNPRIAAKGGPDGGGEQAANNGGVRGPRSVTLGSGPTGATNGLLMPAPPDTLGPAAAARLEQAKGAAGTRATASASLPRGDKTVGEARGAVREPGEETKARAEGDLTTELDQRPPPSLKIFLLCIQIYLTIRSKRPPDEESLVEAKPKEMAQEAGKSLQKDVTAETKGVQSQYDALDKPPAGKPASQPTPYTQPANTVDAPPIAATGAAPDPIPPENVSLDADIAAQGQKIADAGMDTEPAKLVQTGPIADARAAHGELAQQGPEGPAQVLQQQQQAIQSAQSNMAELQGLAVAAMANARTTAIGARAQQQVGMVGSEEQMRAVAGKRMSEIFTAAQAQVNTLLEPVPTRAMDKWDKGVLHATTLFEQTLQRVALWIQQRHAGFIGKIRAAGDWLTGLPSWVTATYDQAEKLFGDTVCLLLMDISRDVNAVVMACEAVIAAARTQIDALVQSLPAQLQDWAAGEASRANADLDGLQAHANAVRDGFENDLEDRARGAVQEVREKVHALREAAGGLLGKIGDAISAFLEDPAKYIIDGLLSLLGISPAAFWAVVAKVQSVVEDIADDPLGFATNLLSAIGQGFQLFFDNVGAHLLDGFLEWLFSGLGSVGVQVPGDFSLKSIVTLFLQLMGLTWDRIRVLLAKHIGEDNVALIEQAYALVATLIEQGPAGIFEMIKEQLDPQMLVDMVIQSAVDYMLDVLISRVTVRVLAMFNPVGAILTAIEAIYRVLKWIFQNAARIFSLVETVVNGIADIVAGNTGGMAIAIESALSGLIGPVIGFLADFMGLGSLPAKIASFIGGIQDRVLAVVDRVIGFLADKARALLAALGIGKKPEDAENEETGEFDGELGERMQFEAGGENHTLWVETTKQGAVIKMASVPQTLVEHCNDWIKQANLIGDTNTIKTIMTIIDYAVMVEKHGAELRNPRTTEDRYNEVDAEVVAIEKELRTLLPPIISAFESNYKIITQVEEPVKKQFKKRQASDKELERQLKMQEDAINMMTVTDWIRHRDRYVIHDRDERAKGYQISERKQQEEEIQTLLKLELSEAKKRIRASAIPDKKYVFKSIVDIFKSKNYAHNSIGLPQNMAESEAKNWMSSRHVLHSPDLSAGGEYNISSGLGDASTNRYIGGHWSRNKQNYAEEIRQETETQLKKSNCKPMTWRLIKMNVALEAV